MHGHVLVPLLKSVVLLHIMEIVTSDDDCPVHFHLGDDSSENTPTNGHLKYQDKTINFTNNNNLSNEGTLLVNVVASLGLSRDLESKTWVAEEPGL